MADQIESKQQELQVLKELQQASGGLADRLEGLVDRVRALKESSSGKASTMHLESAIEPKYVIMLLNVPSSYCLRFAVSTDVLGRWRELFRVAGLRESLELVLVKTLAAQ